MRRKRMIDGWNGTNIITREYDMSWLCKLGLHSWMKVWDNTYDSVCDRADCCAVKRSKPRVDKQLPIRHAAIMKFEKFRMRG